MSKVSTWSTTAASNNSVSPDGFPEGMNPSGLNDSAREVMAQVRAEREDSEWFDRGQTPTYVSTTSFTLTGDQTTDYHVGRRVKLTDASTLYGTIATSAYTSLTTITVTLDSGVLSGSLTAVYLGILSASNDSIPTGIDASKIADGSVSDTEFQYISTLSSNAQTQITAGASALTAHEADTSTHGVTTVAGISESQTLTNKVIGDTNTITAQSDAFLIVDSVDSSKQIGFAATGTTGTQMTLVTNPTVNRTLIFPDADDNLIGKLTPDTLANKSIDLASNTLTGTVAQFNTALSDDSFATLGDAETFTGQKTFNEDIVMQSANGIDYSARAGGAGSTSKVLYAYDEGTFTPTLSPASGTITLSTANGRYIRIGSLFHIFMEITVSSLGSASGAVTIKGLPIYPYGAIKASLSVGYAANLNITAGQVVTAYQSGSSGEVSTTAVPIHLQIWDATTGTSVLDVSDLTATTTLYVSGALSTTSAY